MVNYDQVISRIKALKNLSADYKVAKLFNLSGPDFSKRKKTGTLLPIIVEWGINQKVNMEWLLRGIGEPCDTVTYPDQTAGEDQVRERKGTEYGTKADAHGVDHAEIAGKFKNKDLAREITMDLVEIERIDPQRLREIGAYIKGVRSALRSDGPEMRDAGQGQSLEADKRPGSGERR